MQKKPTSESKNKVCIITRSRNPIIMFYFSLAADTHVMNGLMYPCECLLSLCMFLPLKLLIFPIELISFSLVVFRRKSKRIKNSNLIRKPDVSQTVWLVKCVLWCINLNFCCLKKKCALLNNVLQWFFLQFIFMEFNSNFQEVCDAYKK